MKITRRQLAGAVAGSAVVALAAAQTPAPVTRDFDGEARESHRANSEALKKFDLPMSTEPAFAFKA